MSYNFSSKRQNVPYPVLAVQAGFPLVRAGGSELSQLREQYFDAILDSINESRAYFVSPYDIAMAGGEPYGVWV